MSWSRVCVLPGDALVARSGDAVVVVDVADPGQDEVRRALLAVVRDLAGSGTAPRRGLVTRRLVASIVQAPPEAVPAFAVAARSADGTELLLVGDMAAEWQDDAGEHRVSGRDGPNWVDHFVPGAVAKLFVGREGAAGEGHPLADLRDGAVVGDAAVVEVDAAAGAGVDGEGGATAEVPAAPVPEVGAPPSAPPASAPPSAPPPSVPPSVPPPPAAVDAEAPAPAPEASIHTGGGPVMPAAPRREQPEPSPASFVSLHFGEDDDDDVEDRAPLPLATDDRAAEPEPAPDLATGPPLVPGMRCAVGHFNHPESRYCVVCGRGFDQGVSRIVVQGPRPPLGVLVIDDGSAFVLDTDYVIGREPDLDPAVSAGTARALALSDTNRTVSRLHADVHLEGWDAVVVDRGSTNGTYVLLPGATQWSRVPPSGRAVVPPGARVAVGQRTFVYESHHVGAR